jgi:CYTH domain-containing protein
MEKKFLVSPITSDAIPVRSETVQIMQIYLHNDTCAERIRERSQETYGTVYYHTSKQGKQGNLLETERQISEHEFRTLMLRIEHGTNSVGKNRTCFIWNERYYELDAFDWPFEGLFLLEAERLYARERIEIPPFIHVIQDVSHDPFYSNYHLARM